MSSPGSRSRCVMPLAAAAMGALFGAAGGQALGQTWDGGGSDNNWTTAQNWAGDIAPLNDGTANATMAGVVKLAVGFNSSQFINSLSFDSTAGAFGIYSFSPLNVLTLGGGGMANNSGSSQVLAVSTVLAADQQWSNAAAGSVTVSNLLNLAGRNLAVDVSGAGAILISNGISGGAGTITKTGSGTLAFSTVTTANTYTGATTVNGGTLALYKLIADGAVVGPLIIGDGTGVDTVRLDAANQIAATSAVSINSSGVLDLNGFSESLSGLTLIGGRVTTGVGTLTTTAAITTNASASTASIMGFLDLGGATRTITVADGAATVDLRVTGTISNGGLTLAGTGTLELAGGANTYAGLTTVDGGTLVLAKIGAGINAIPGNLVIGDAAGAAGNEVVRVQVLEQIPDTATVTINPTGVLEVAAQESIGPLAMTSGSVIGSGTITLLGNVTTNAHAAAATIGNGPGQVDFGGGTRTFTVADGAALSDLAIFGTVINGGLIKSGAGELLLQGATFASAQTSVNEGTLALNGTALGGPIVIGDGLGGPAADVLHLYASDQITDGSTVTVASSGEFNLNDRNETIGGLYGVTGALVSLGSGTLTFGGNSASATYAGTISGAGGIVKLGTGTQTMSGPSLTYTGSTLVGGGTLVLESSLTTSSAWTIATDASAALTPGGTKVIRTGALTISGTGKLDLKDNKLITASPLGTWNGSAYTGVAGLVDSGRGNASNAQWDGSGIVTSDTRAVNNNDLCSIGVALASQVRGIAPTATTTFAGQTVLGSDTIAMFTYAGDANLDGAINIDDYGRIDASVAQSGSVSGWYNGDFNYDGAINIDDYGIIDGNLARQGEPFITAIGAAADSLQIGTAVPEPVTAAVWLAIPLTHALRRQRRTHERLRRDQRQDASFQADSY